MTYHGVDIAGIIEPVLPIRQGQVTSHLILSRIRVHRPAVAAIDMEGCHGSQHCKDACCCKKSLIKMLFYKRLIFKPHEKTCSKTACQAKAHVYNKALCTIQKGLARLVLDDKDNQNSKYHQGNKTNEATNPKNACLVITYLL